MAYQIAKTARGVRTVRDRVKQQKMYEQWREKEREEAKLYDAFYFIFKRM